MAANGRVESPQPLCLSDIHQLRADASRLRRAAQAERESRTGRIQLGSGTRGGRGN